MTRIKSALGIWKVGCEEQANAICDTMEQRGITYQMEKENTYFGGWWIVRTNR